MTNRISVAGLALLALLVAGCTAAVPTLEGMQNNPSKVDPYLSLTSPSTNISNQATLTFDLQKIDAGATFKLYTSSTCTGTEVTAQTAAGNFSLTLTADQVYQFYYAITDSDGIVGDCKDSGISYTYDSQVPGAPNLSTVPTWSHDTTNSPALTFTATDFGPAGIDKVLAQVSGGSWIEVTNGNSIHGPFTDGSTYTVTLKAIDKAGNESPTGSSATWTVDATAPNVSLVTSSSANSNYGYAQSINIQLHFNEAVTVTGGTPQLSLNTGGTATYSTGSGSNTLDFIYTVGPAQDSSDLDYANTSAFTLNGATITDASGLDAVLALPAPGSANSLAGQKAIVVDTSPPMLGGVVEDGVYYNSASMSPLLSWSPATDAGSGVQYYKLAIGTAPGYSDIVNWSNVGTLLGTQIATPALTNGETYYASVKAYDSVGNVSTFISSNGWIVDTLVPTSPGPLDDGIDTFDTTRSPLITWAPSNDGSGSGVNRYEIALGTSLGGTQIQNWMPVGLSTSYQFTGLNLSRGQVYYASVRSVDNVGNFSTVATGDGWSVNSELWVPNGPVKASVQKDKTLYIGGSFNYVGPSTGGGAALDMASGSIAPGFDYKAAKVDGIVYASVADGSGGFYIGGSFTQVGNTPRSNIAHILSNGTVDIDFIASADGDVRALALSGDKLYMGGNFSNYLGALNRTTGASFSWTTGLNAIVYALALSPDGSTLYVGGGFTSPRSRLASFETSTGDLTSWNPNAGNIVYAIAVDGTTAYVGGTFTTMNGGTTRNRLASFETSTGNLTGWNPNAGNIVYAIAVDGTTAYVGGTFTTMNGGTTRNRLASFDTGTGNLNTWDPNIGASVVYSIAAYGSVVFVGGQFTSVGAGIIRRNYLAAFDAITGNLASGFSGSAGSTVKTISTYGPRLYVGGSFTSAGGVIRERLAAIDLKSGIATMHSFLNSSSSSVNALALFGSDLIVGGKFTSVGGKVDLTKFTLPASETPFPTFSYSSTNGVNALLINGNDLYVGGSFSSPGMNLFALGDLDMPIPSVKTFNPIVGGTSDYVKALAMAGTTLYAGGSFTSVNSAVHGGPKSRNKLAAFDTTGNGMAITFNADTAVGGMDFINALTLSPSGALYIGGSATGTCLQAVNSSDGSPSTSAPPSPSNCAIYSLVTDPSDKIFVGGYTGAGFLKSFTSGSTSFDAGFDPAPDSTVSSITLLNSAMYIGGSFQHIGSPSKYSTSFAPLNPSSGQVLP